VQINLVYDAQAQAAPQSFRDAIQAAANIFDATFWNAGEFNISVGYGEIDGTPEPSGSASGAPSASIVESYSQVLAALAAYKGPLTPLDSFDVTAGLEALPSTGSVQGYTDFAVWSAEAKALNLIGLSGTEIDGAVGFATDIPTNELVAVALHELAQALGLVASDSSQPDVFDLFRYASPGTLLFGDTTPSPTAYFSLNGGTTAIADYGINSDPSAFLDSSGLTPNDPFNESNSSTLPFLTRADVLQMEALGFQAQAHPVGDFHNDFLTDVLWRSDSGDIELWASSASNPVGIGLSGLDLGVVQPAWQIQQIADVTGDGRADLVWRNTSTGDVGVWYTAVGSGAPSFTEQDFGVVSPDWHLQGSGDFSAAGPDSLLWRDDDGTVGLWTFPNSAGPVTVTPAILAVVSNDWQIAGVGDFNGDSKTDILWRNTTNGDVGLWDSVPGEGSISFTEQDLGVVDNAWQIQGVGDFNGDGKADILWRNTATGDVLLWNSVSTPGVISFAGEDLGVVPLDEHIQEIGNFQGTPFSDVLWRDDNGNVIVWYNTTADSVFERYGTLGSPVSFHQTDFFGEGLSVPDNWHIQSNWFGT
jgi:hypothetical protein